MDMGEVSVYGEAIESQIRSHWEEAERQEACGCFGVAEISFRSALRLSEAHVPRLTGLAASKLGHFLYRYIPWSEATEKYLRLGLQFKDCLDSSEIAGLTLALVDCLLEKESGEEAENLLSSIQSADVATTVRVADAKGRLRVLELQFEEGIEAIIANIEHARKVIPDSPVLAECLFHWAEIEWRKYEKEFSKSAFEAIFAIQGADQTLIKATRLLMKMTISKHPGDVDEFSKSIIERLKERQVQPYLLAQVFESIADAFSWSIPNNYSAMLYDESLKIYKSNLQTSWHIIRVTMKIDAHHYENSGLQWTKSELDEMSARLPTVSSILSLVGKNTPSRFFFRQYAEKVEQLAVKDSDCVGDALFVLFKLNGRNGRRIKGIKCRMHQYMSRHPFSSAYRLLANRYKKFCLRTIQKLNDNRLYQQRSDLLHSLQLEKQRKWFPEVAALTYIELSHINFKVFKRNRNKYLSNATKIYASITFPRYKTVIALKELSEANKKRCCFSEAIANINQAISLLQRLPNANEALLRSMESEVEQLRSDEQAMGRLRHLASQPIPSQETEAAVTKAVFTLVPMSLLYSDFKCDKALLLSFLDRVEKKSVYRVEALLRYGKRCSPQEALQVFFSALDLLLESAPQHVLILQVALMTSEILHHFKNSNEIVQEFIERMLSAKAVGEASGAALSAFDLQSPSSFKIKQLATTARTRFPGTLVAYRLQEMLLRHFICKKQHLKCVQQALVVLSELERSIHRDAHVDCSAIDLTSQGEEVPLALRERTLESSDNRWRYEGVCVTCSSVSLFLSTVPRELLRGTCKLFENHMAHTPRLGDLMLLSNIVQCYRDNCWFEDAERVLVKFGVKECEYYSKNGEILKIRELYKA